jgi:hypothetical protein
MAAALGFWEDSDQLNLVATFLDPKVRSASTPELYRLCITESPT